MSAVVEDGDGGIDNGERAGQGINPRFREERFVLEVVEKIQADVMGTARVAVIDAVRLTMVLNIETGRCFDVPGGEIAQKVVKYLAVI